MPAKLVLSILLYFFIKLLALPLFKNLYIHWYCKISNCNDINSYCTNACWHMAELEVSRELIPLAIYFGKIILYMTSQ